MRIKNKKTPSDRHRMTLKQVGSGEVFYFYLNSEGLEIKYIKLHDPLSLPKMEGKELCCDAVTGSILYLDSEIQVLSIPEAVLKI